jgi:hypothetical protein
VALVSTLSNGESVEDASERARLLARFAHYHQRDKADTNYYSSHVQGVAQMSYRRAEEEGMSPEECAIAGIVGYLHDVAEDEEETHVSMEMIGAFGFAAEIMVPLDLVTLTPGVTREEYIGFLKDHPIARVVKAADIDSNTSYHRMCRLAHVDPKAPVRLLKKYIRDFEQLEMTPRWSLRQMLDEFEAKLQGAPA